MNDFHTAKLAKKLLTERIKQTVEKLIEERQWTAEVSEPTPNNLLIHVRRAKAGPMFFEIKIKESW
jgi:hypothetical protein